MSTLAPGLVWCKDCQVRHALASEGGRCPVCDPAQGNAASSRADQVLESIDDVLAGVDQSSWDSLAHWSPEQLEDHDDDWEPESQLTWAHLSRGDRRFTVILPRRSGHGAYLERAREIQGLVAQVGHAIDDRRVAAYREAIDAGTVHVAPVSAPVDLADGWENLGHVIDGMSFSSGTHDDAERFTLGPSALWHVPQTMTFEMTFDRDTMQLFWGGPLPSALSAWAPAEWSRLEVCRTVARTVKDVPYVDVPARTGLPARYELLEDDTPPAWVRFTDRLADAHT